MSTMQAFVDGLSAQRQRDRAQTQMTLGGLIAALEAMPADAPGIALGEPHSYRGYYCDIAFERQDEARHVGDVLADCKQAMGQVFQGYKGGDYVMGAQTPVWVAFYGDCGAKLVAIAADGSITTQEDDE